MRVIGPRHLDVSRALQRRWRLAAGAVVLGLVAVAVPDSASVRWAFVAGLIVLYPVVGAAVMSRDLSNADAVPVDPAVEPPPSGSAQVVVAVVVPPVVVPVDPRAERLAARGEAMWELHVVNTERQGAAVPRQRGPITLETTPAVTLDPGACWIPMDDAAAAAGPGLRSGWPFDSRAAEPAGTERPVGG